MGIENPPNTTRSGMTDGLREEAKGLPPVLSKKAVHAAMKAARPEYLSDIRKMRFTVEGPISQLPTGPFGP